MITILYFYSIFTLFLRFLFCKQTCIFLRKLRVTASSFCEIKALLREHVPIHFFLSFMHRTLLHLFHFLRNSYEIINSHIYADATSDSFRQPFLHQNSRNKTKMCENVGNRFAQICRPQHPNLTTCINYARSTWKQNLDCV